MAPDKRNVDEDPAESDPGVTSHEPPERFLKIAEVCHRAGLCQAMIYRLIKQDRFPAPYKINGSMSRWSEKEVVAWIAEVKFGFEGKRRKFW